TFTPILDQQNCKESSDRHPAIEIMSEDLQQLIISNQVDNLYECIDSFSGRYLFFSHIDSSDEKWVVSACNGKTVWRLKADYSYLDSHKELATHLTFKAYFDYLKNACKSKEISIGQMSNQLSLTFGIGTTSIAYNLREASANESKQEISYILFKLADSVTDLRKDLDSSKQKLKDLQTKDVISNEVSTVLFGTQTKKSKQPIVKRKAGQSLVNPGSRKRRIGGGVQFD
ncbi:hypothetical protein TrispH2_007508, partial [Trichoplax sp. H2]